MPKRRPSNLETSLATNLANIETVVVPPPTTKRVVSNIDANIHVTGKYSGQEYFFVGAGSVVDVDEKDVEWLLSKRQGERQCCGGTGNGNVVFTLED